MAKELPYFQFEPAEYLTGDIQFCSYAAQGLFMNICAIYWQRGCVLSKNQLEQKFTGNEGLLQELYLSVLKTKKNNILIEFLDEQYFKLGKSKKINSENGKKGAEAKKKKSATPHEYYEVEARLKPIENENNERLKHLDKIREDKIREDKIREDKIREDREPPKIEEFLNYCNEILLEKFLPLEFSLRAKFETWVGDGWKDGHGKKIKNWKSKIKNTIPFLKPLQNGTPQQPKFFKPSDQKQFERDQLRAAIDEKIRNSGG